MYIVTYIHVHVNAYIHTGSVYIHITCTVHSTTHTHVHVYICMLKIMLMKAIFTFITHKHTYKFLTRSSKRYMASLDLGESFSLSASFANVMMREEVNYMKK